MPLATAVVEKEVLVATVGFSSRMQLYCVQNTLRLLKVYLQYLGKWAPDFLLNKDHHLLDIGVAGGSGKARRVGLSF